MLTKRQLEAISKCAYTICYKCDIQKDCPRMPEAASLAARTAIAYREMLERLEWSLKQELLKNYRHYCPICERNKLVGHAADCELAALLKESEGEEG